DHYHRWPEDLDLLADLGVDAYRLSIAWPRISAIAGYAQGRHAPGAREWHGALAAAHHLLLAHGLAVAALRPYGRPVGVTLNLSPVVPLSTSDADGLAACRADIVHNRLFLDPLLRGAYPDDYDAVLGSLTDRCAGGAGSDDAGLTDRA